MPVFLFFFAALRAVLLVRSLCTQRSSVIPSFPVAFLSNGLYCSFLFGPRPSSSFSSKHSSPFMLHSGLYRRAFFVSHRPSLPPIPFNSNHSYRRTTGKNRISLLPPRNAVLARTFHGTFRFVLEVLAAAAATAAAPSVSSLSYFLSSWSRSVAFPSRRRRGTSRARVSLSFPSFQR